MDTEMLNEKTKIAIDKFQHLHGSTFIKKKRSLNCFIKELQSDYSSEEIEDVAQNLKTQTEYDHMLKAEIIVHFQLELQIWDILKSDHEAAIGKILKNWLFFKNIFNNIAVDSFVNEILPLLSYKTMIKVINIIGKNLGDNEQLSDNLFKKLEEHYGIKVASILLSACSLKLIKEKCSKYSLALSSRCLLQIYKKDRMFLWYYFNLIRIIKHKDIWFDGYIQVLKFAAKTDQLTFWKLYDKYKFSIKMGRRRTRKMLSDRESVTKHAFTNAHLFPTKYLLNAVRKVGLHKKFLLKNYPDNLQEYIEYFQSHSSKMAIADMPRSQVFPLLKDLFAQKYEEDLVTYLHHMHGNYLQYVTVPEREFILDKLTDKEDWLHYYPTNRSIPIIKEKLKSANDPQTRRNLIHLLYNTCNINKDPEALLHILTLLYQRYKNDTNSLSHFVDLLQNWYDFNTFTDEHWEITYNLIEYLLYSNVYVHEFHFFERRFIWLVDNNKSYATLLDDYVTESNERRSLMTHYCFDQSLKHKKILIEEIHKRLQGKHHRLYSDFLLLVIEFDKRFPKEISVINYAYILDIISPQPGQIYYFIKHYNEDKSFNKYIIYFDHNLAGINTDFVMYCLQNCPEELDIFENLHKKLYLTNKQFYELLLCPHFMNNYFDTFKKMAIDQLRNKETQIQEIILKCLCFDKDFLKIIPEFEPPEDAKIGPQTDKIFVAKQQSIIKYIPNVPSPQNMKLIRTFCKGDYLKYALCALYKTAYKSPQFLIFDFLQNIHEAAVSVKKHALFLGRHLLPVNLYYDFLLSVSDIEINMSMRNILLKKSLEYFIENVDTNFFALFVRNLDKIDKNDRDLYNYLLNYEKIPQEFMGQYITVVYESIVTNKDAEIRKKRCVLMEGLPGYLVEDLEFDLMKSYLLSVPLGTTNFINKCIFHTTGIKYDEICTFIFDLILDNIKNCDRTNVNARNNISNVISNICKEAIQLDNNAIVQRLDAIRKTSLPQHCFITTTLLLDFCMILLKSKKILDVFVKEISIHLFEFVKLYSSNVISLYETNLKSFLHNNSMDQFEFIEKFFNLNAADDITCLMTVAFLPHYVPTKKNAYAEYLPILDALLKIQVPSVIAHLDMYFSSVSS